MSAAPGPTATRRPRPTGVRPWRRRFDRAADAALRGICLLAALLGGVVVTLIAYEVVAGARPAIAAFGPGFLLDAAWQPNFGLFGAGPLLYGTLVSSAFALLLGAPIAISIGIFLGLLAPTGLRRAISPLVEMLAAIPSVILGFWGILVAAPFLQRAVEPGLHDALGLLPVFGPPEATGSSLFTAGLILTIMVIPIIASVSRDLFAAVPRELQDGASALGATRWEVVRGVVLPATGSGLAAACLLGLGRALGEAIAVAQVIGAGSEVRASLFETGDTLAARIANQFPGALTEMHRASLYYLGVILLVIGIGSNLAAHWIGRRFGFRGSTLR